MRIKKFLAVLIVIFLLTAFVGCDALNGKNNGDNNANDGDTNGESGVYLKDIYAWIDELDVEDVVKVRYERGSMGVTPGDLTDVSYSSNSADIDATCALLSSKLTLLDDDFRFPVGGAYVQYDFYTSNGETYSISMSVDLGCGLVYFNNQFYSVQSFQYRFQHSYLDCHSFTDHADLYSVCSADDKYESYGEIYLGNLEFCAYDGNIDAQPSYRLMGNFVNLMVLSDNLFTIEGRNTVYQVTSATDFSELFEDNGNNEASLKDIYAWIDNLDVNDIVEVRYEQGGVAVAPGSLINVSYSTNNVDIQNTYALLFGKLEKCDINEGLDGGSYVKYTFYTNSDAYSIRISNNLVQINSQYYRVSSFNYKFQHSDLDCYSLVSYSNLYKSYSYKNGSEQTVDLSVLGKFEFCTYVGRVALVPSYRLKGDGVSLLVLSNNLFMIEDDYEGDNIVYQLTGEKDFSEFFSDYFDIAEDVYPWEENLVA